MSNIEEDIKEIRESIEEAYRSYDYDLDYSPFSKGIAEILERILSERESDKKRIKELEEERDQWHGCFIVTMENSIPKQKVKDVLQNNRNELFSTTYINDEQYKPYTMQIKRINKIENELLEDK